jgi:SpoVK/Ycf46/Vps4 family AAA+-type ATPase
MVLLQVQHVARAGTSAAVLTARRFDRRIEVPPPDAAARAAFFCATVQRPEIASHLR